jgi:hypothetical protein
MERLGQEREASIAGDVFFGIVMGRWRCIKAQDLEADARSHATKNQNAQGVGVYRHRTLVVGGQLQPRITYFSILHAHLARRRLASPSHGWHDDFCLDCDNQLLLMLGA